MPKKTAPVSFARRLRTLRTAAGLSAYALARETGISRQVLSNIERGKTRPTWETACKLADALGVTTESLRT